MNQPAETTIAARAASSCSNRVRSRVGPATRYTDPSAGTTSSACPIFVRKPIPISAPHSTSHHVDALAEAESIARTTAYADATSVSTSRASGLSKRNISTAAGVSANAAPASSPAPGPAHRLTAAYSSATAATPSSAWGTSRLQELNPKIRALAVMIHSEAGGLSTVIASPESSEPNSHAFTACVPACTAAA